MSSVECAAGGVWVCVCVWGGGGGGRAFVKSLSRRTLNPTIVFLLHSRDLARHAVLPLHSVTWLCHITLPPSVTSPKVAAFVCLFVFN